MIWNPLQDFYFCFVRWTSWTCIKANESPPPTQHRFQYNDENLTALHQEIQQESSSVQNDMSIPMIGGRVESRWWKSGMDTK